MVDEGVPARLFNLVVELGLLAWIKATQLKDTKCTKIKQLLKHKGFALTMMDCSPMSVCWRVMD